MSIADNLPVVLDYRIANRDPRGAACGGIVATGRIELAAATLRQRTASKPYRVRQVSQGYDPGVACGSKAAITWLVSRYMPDLTVYVAGEMNVPLWIRAPGEQLASDIFASIGIRIKWSRRVPPEDQVRREGAVSVDIRGREREDQGGRVAEAMPYEGSKVMIAYGRLRWIELNPLTASKVFAYVLVHEIAHNLQGVARHSDTGIMKSRWTAADYRDMRSGELRFEPYDVQLIQTGLASRRPRLLGATEFTTGISKARP
ncbi:MAG TPA: hypothetical protein VMH28_19155 [Candidatus Acidoferrales bacterium]|nr:hypothetical protein [Candidatus Acidoferrales bacterium]